MTTQRMKISGSWMVGKVLEAAGLLLAAASAVWLGVRLVAPHGESRLLEVAVLVPMACAGLGLAWFGHSLLRRDRRTLRDLIGGYRASAMLNVAAKLGIADLLAGGPRSSAELARSLGAHAASLHRLLRGLVTLGICAEEKDGRFALTALGALLRADAPRSARGSALLCGEEYYAAWGGLLHSVMTGEPAFEHLFGMSQWKHREQHPELNEYFNQGLEYGTARGTEAVLAAYDFSRFRTVADVGGGYGALIAAVLKAHPSVNGILFDQAHVVDGARAYLEAAGVAARCQVLAVDFFDHLSGGADALVVKSVINDWNDERALTILKNCRRALAGQGTLLLIERILPAQAREDPGLNMFDLHGLAVTGGRQRTAEQHGALLEAAGFRMTRVIPTRSGLSMIEAVPAGAAADGPGNPG